MKIKSVAIRGAMTFKNEVKLDLPETGLVLLTGANGAGKSSFAEAVSLAFWNDTLRGTKMWRENEDGRIDVELYDSNRLSRTPKATPASRSFAGEIYETQTKQLAAVAAHYGTHDAWRRTHVFSSESATKFTAATDLERKAFLESILGLDRFDAAYEDATEAAKAQARVVQRCEGRVADARGKIDVVRARLEELSAAVGAERAAPEPEEHIQSAVRARSKVKHDRDEHDAAISRMRDESAEVKAALAEERKRRARLDANQCPTCRQPISDSLRASIDREIADLQARAEKSVQVAAESMERLKATRDRLAEEIDEHTETIERIKADRRAWEAAQARMETLRVNAAKYRAEGLELADALEEAEAALDVALAELRVLEAARKVLAVNGVRSYMLGQALDTITDMANAWLGRLIGRPLQLKLSPYTERAKGAIKESLALDVVGAGGGFGYKAASGGERRRIDIALMLALAEVASTALARDAGTLWMDEVFDALDDDGVEACCDVLEELARMRCVVVITHNDVLRAKLAKRVPTGHRYTVLRNGAGMSSLARA